MLTPAQWRDLQLHEHQTQLLDRARPPAHHPFRRLPPRVDYELTPLGLTLIEPIRTLLDWTIDNRAAMAEARLVYAKASKKTA